MTVPQLGARSEVRAVETDSQAEHDAILAGVRAGDAALARFRHSAFLELFPWIGASPRAEPRLEALQAYAELRRVLLAQGFVVPPASLVTAGYSSAQIARFDAIIAAVPSENSAPHRRSKPKLRSLKHDRN